MFRNWVFFTCSCLSLSGWVHAFNGPFEQRNDSSYDSSYDEMNDLNRELIENKHKIKVLKAQLHKLQLVEMREEVEGQGLSIGDWEGYSKELQTIRQQYDKQRELLDQLEKLELHQAELISRLRKADAS